MSELIIKKENTLYSVSVTLDNTAFNNELLNRVFHFQVVSDNLITATSYLLDIEEVSKLVDYWFNIKNLYK